MKMPGFRKGKVPAQLVIQRIGREAVVEQALRDGLPEWYERALLDSGVASIGDPKLDVGELPGEGEELTFTIEVGVRPKAELGDWQGPRGRQGRDRGARPMRSTPSSTGCARGSPAWRRSSGRPPPATRS